MRSRGIDRHALTVLPWTRMAMVLALLVGSFFVPTPPSAVADHGCIRAPWPSFREVAPTARRVVVGTVAENLWRPASNSRTHWFRLDVEEVLRGSSPAVLEIRSLQSGLPRRIVTDPHCDAYPTLWASVRKRVAIAFGGRVPGIEKPITTVALIDRLRGPNGAEGLTLGEVRRITGNAPRKPARSATVERDGFRLSLTISRNPLVAGQPAWVRTKVRNLRDEPIYWSAGTKCESSVWVHARMTDATWRLFDLVDGPPRQANGGYIRPMTDLRWVVQEGWKEWWPEIWLAFLREPADGCAETPIPPGDVVIERHRWDGQASGNLGPPPAGAARVTGTFSYRLPGDDRRSSIRAHVDAWIDEGRDPDWLHPMEIVDAAVADPRYGSLLDGFSLGYDSGEYVAFDTEREVWVVGACGAYDGERVHWKAVSLDPATGRVIDLIKGPGGENCEQGPWAEHQE